MRGRPMAQTACPRPAPALPHPAPPHLASPCPALPCRHRSSSLPGGRRPLPPCVTACVCAVAVPAVVAPQLLGLAALLSWLQLVQLGWLWPQVAAAPPLYRLASPRRPTLCSFPVLAAAPSATPSTYTHAWYVQGCAALALFLDAVRCLPSALALAAPAALGGFVAGLALQCFDAYPDELGVGGGGGGGGGMLRMARATCQWLLLPIAFVLAAGLAASSPYPLAHRAELERSRCLLWRDLSLGPEELRAVSARVRGTAW